MARPKQIISMAELEGEKVLRLLRQKYDLKVLREAKAKEAREMRQAVYNLSQQINALEAEIDKKLIGMITDDKQDQA